MTTTATSVRTLIEFANGVHPRQINGPAWIDSAHYDVTAKSDQAGAPSISQMRIMMQKVLVDRFQLVSHRERKELAVYAITIAKGGPKLAPTWRRKSIIWLTNGTASFPCSRRPALTAARYSGSAWAEIARVPLFFDLFG